MVEYSHLVYQAKNRKFIVEIKMYYDKHRLSDLQLFCFIRLFHQLNFRGYPYADD